MKRRKQVNMDEEYKKLLQSISWITDLLSRYFEGQLNKQEEEIVEEHLQSIDRQTEGKTELTENQLVESDDKIKKQVFLRLNLVDPEKQQRKPSLALFFRKYAAIAAIFAMVIASSYFVFGDYSLLRNKEVTSLYSKTVFLQTGETEIKEFTLPDGTKLYANSTTRIDYIEDQFNKEKREIWLEGEAFFDVAKNPDKPFIIHSDKVQTVVRGTSFNVRSYKEIGEINVSVRTGVVEVSVDRNTFGELTANKRIVYNTKTDQHVITESNWEEEMAWRDRRLVLKDGNIAELKLRLKQLYGVEISTEGAFPADQRFGLSFRKGASLTEIMGLIENMYGVRYKTTDSGNIIIYR